MMFLKKEQTDRQTEERKQKRKKKRKKNSILITNNIKRETFYKVHYLVPHALHTIIAQKKKKEKRRAGVVLVEQ